MDLCEDLLRRLSPDEGSRILIAMFQIGVEGVNELGDAVDGQPFELPFVEFTEEAFHEIGPGGAGGDEVDVDAGISGQPGPDFSCLCVP